MTADTAYQMWGVAQPGIPKTGPVKWLKDDCHRAATLTLQGLRAVLDSLKANAHVNPDYCAFWIGYYETALQLRETA
jgi:hypothetical protein